MPSRSVTELKLSTFVKNGYLVLRQRCVCVCPLCKKNSAAGWDEGFWGPDTRPIARYFLRSRLFSRSPTPGLRSSSTQNTQPASIKPAHNYHVICIRPRG